MENNTPAVRKQTFWLQAMTFVSLVLVSVTENQVFMETFTQAGAYAGMALTGVTILLGFLNPIGYDQNNPVEKELKQSDDLYIRHTTKDF